MLENQYTPHDEINPSELHFRLQNIWRRSDGITRLLDVLPLVKEQIGGRESVVKMTFQSRLVKAQVKYTNQQNWKRGQRGQVFCFSQASRKRLFELFARLEMTKRAVFLTLTYERDFPDAKTAKNHLRAFFERVRRKFPDAKVSAVWRMEFQERGAPHFHIIFFNLPFFDKDIVARYWKEIIGGHLPFTRIEMIQSTKKLTNYVSKYTAKLGDTQSLNGGFNSPTYLHADTVPDGRVFDPVMRTLLQYQEAYEAIYGKGIGRVWGVFNRENLPFGQEIVMTWPETRGEFQKFRGFAIQEYPRIEEQRGQGFTLYVKRAIRWRDLALKCGMINHAS